MEKTIMRTTTDKAILDKLTNSDMANICSAFQTDDPDTYFTWFFRQPEGLLMDDFFYFLCRYVNMDKYIQEYIALPEDYNVRYSFWCRYKREGISTIHDKGQIIKTNIF